MRRRLSLALLVAIAVAAAGCIDVESIVTVNHDGSGVIEETTLLSPQLSAMMAMVSAQEAQAAQGRGGVTAPPGGPDLLLTRASAETKAKQMGPGVTVKSLEDLKSPDGRQGQKVVFAFTNIGQVSYDTGNMANTPTMTGAGAAGGSISFAFSDGAVTVRMKKAAGSAAAPGATPRAADAPGLGGATSAMPAIPPDQAVAMLKPMLSGMRIAFRVKAASGIASTDATYVNGDTVTLVDVQFDKLFDNPDVMAKITAMSDNPSVSAADAGAALKGIPGVQAETKDTIVIRLK